MRNIRGAILILGLAALAMPASAERLEANYGAFRVEHAITVPGSPEQIYDLLSGDISDWWDHHISERPTKLFIEAKPGGHFIEIFDESGDGAIHATVIRAERGKQLTFSGPLGFGGHALELVCGYALSPADGGGTRIQLSVSGAGALQDGWPEAVDGVWHHFLVEQFKPYAEAKAAGAD